MIDGALDPSGRLDSSFASIDFESSSGFGGSSKSQLMQYFMLNKIFVEVIDNTYHQMICGFRQIQVAALDLVCKLITNIASSITRQKYLALFR
jgi:hypothetical protein